MKKKFGAQIMNTKRKLCFIINLILSLAIMTVIFLFSTESGEM